MLRMINYFMSIPINQVYWISLTLMGIVTLLAMVLHKKQTGHWPIQSKTFGAYLIAIILSSALSLKIILLLSLSQHLNNNLTSITVNLLNNSYTKDSVTKKFDCDQEQSLNTCISTLYDKVQSLKE